MKSRLALVLLVSLCLVFAGCVQKPVPTPTPTPVATPVPSVFVATPTPTPSPCLLSGSTCCRGQLCNAAQVNCVEGTVPRYSGCTDQCVVVANCVPRPTPTPLPPGTLFYDDFEDAITTAGQWAMDPVWTVRKLDNNTFLFASTSRNNSFARFGSPAWTDYAVSMKFKLDGGTFRVIARNSSAGAYIAEVMPNAANLRMQVGGGSAGVIITSQLGRGQEGYRLNASSWHDLVFSLKGQQVKLLIDGDSVFDYYDRTFANGSAALMTVDGVSVSLDFINVSSA